MPYLSSKFLRSYLHIASTSYSVAYITNLAILSTANWTNPPTLDLAIRFILYLTANHSRLPLYQLSLTLFNLSTEKSGKTLHLLKSGSKPIKPRSQRKKIEILGSLALYNDSKKKSVAQQEESQPA